MTSRALALFLFAGSAAAQTPTVSLELSAKGLPVGGPGLLMFGDYAQVSLTARVTPAIGTVITLPNGTSGTVAALADVWFDLETCNGNLGGAQWTLSGASFQGSAGTGTNWGIRPGWTTGSSPGTVQPDNSLFNIAAGQFLAPGQSANAANPVVEIWRGKWTPTPISPGLTTRFIVRPRQCGVLVRTGSFPGGEPLYTRVVAKSEPTTDDLFHDSGPPPPCMPFFSYTSPATIEAFAGDTVQITVSVTPPGAGCPPIQHQWRRGCTTLVDGGNISGAQTATLIFNPVRESDANFYSFAAGAVQGWEPARRLKVACYANCDRSTGAPALTANDFQCYLNKFAAGHPYANCDGVGALTANDFQCFLNRYAAGCS